ncbi:MAG: hypothetical protein JSW64_10075 [Candidatus Zixiibacteriota bacterium]|nr:MAG: hypothetical protein JSW64_10075 [candidate division Zixibacteria bacterium]
MFIWSLVLFGLGILAVLDSQFNYGYIFRSANSLVFMLLSLGVLIRTKMLQRLGYKEQLLKSNIELRSRIEDMERSQTPAEKQKSKQTVTV